MRASGKSGKGGGAPWASSEGRGWGGVLSRGRVGAGSGAWGSERGMLDRRWGGALERANGMAAAAVGQAL